MKTLKITLIALLTATFLFSCEDDAPSPAGPATNDIELKTQTNGGISDGDQTDSFDSGSSSQGTAQEDADQGQNDQDHILGEK